MTAGTGNCRAKESARYHIDLIINSIGRILQHIYRSMSSLREPEPAGTESRIIGTLFWMNTRILEQIASDILYMLSDSGSNITGHVMVSDGGFTL